MTNLAPVSILHIRARVYPHSFGVATQYECAAFCICWCAFGLIWPTVTL